MRYDRTLERCNSGTTADDLLKRTGIGIRGLSDPGGGSLQLSILLAVLHIVKK